MVLFQLEEVNYKNILKYNNITIKKNRITFIIGESGKGKTTLLKLLNGTVSANDGIINYLANPITSYDFIKLRREVLLVSQNIYLFEKSIRDNFYQFYESRNDEKPTDEKIETFLKICCCDFSLDSLCTSLSGGERQRIYIAICMSFSPKVLLLDEPTSALDDNTSHLLLTNLKNFSIENEITLIIVSHNHNLTLKYADDILKI